MLYFAVNNMHRHVDISGGHETLTSSLTIVRWNFGTCLHTVLPPPNRARNARRTSLRQLRDRKSLPLKKSVARPITIVIVLDRYTVSLSQRFGHALFVIV